MELLLIILILCALYYIALACYKFPIHKERINQLLDTEKNLINEKRELVNEKEKLVARCKKLESILQSKVPFSIVAEMFSDICSILYDETELRLKNKSRPAFKAAEEVRELKLRTKSYITQFKEMSYKYNFLLNEFADLKEFVEDEQELLNIAQYLSYSDFEDNRDRSFDFLTSEEWNKLTTSQRNQLALERYIQGRKKSAWAVGRDYEMSCAFALKAIGFNVEMHGIEKGLEDLGRDIIASRFIKDLFQENHYKQEVWIIQCKCWNKDRQIHENVIMQLFGTYVAYKIEHKNIIKADAEIIPVLMIPPFSVVSETAKKFMEILGVKMLIQNFNEFPRIKCNINGNNKIYHLPFDQQYDRTQIKKQGEFYAWSVKDAEEKGFRRAMRHILKPT